MENISKFNLEFLLFFFIINSFSFKKFTQNLPAVTSYASISYELSLLHTIDCPKKKCLGSKNIYWIQSHTDLRICNYMRDFFPRLHVSGSECEHEASDAVSTFISNPSDKM